MKSSQFSLATCVLASCVLVAGIPIAYGQTVIWSDNFPGSAQNLDGAPTTGITGLNGGSGGAQPLSAAVESTINGSGSMNLNTPATSSGDNGYIRFDTVGATSTLYNWAASPGASAITSAGGMIVSLMWTAPDTTGGNWIYFGVGDTAAAQGSDGYNYHVPIWDSGASGGIIFQNNGGVQTFHGSSATVNTGGIRPAGVTHEITLDYSFTSWSVGSPVSLTAIEDGQTVISGDNFTWQNAANYLNLGTYQENSVIGPITITTVPEPGSLAFIGVSGILVFVRRFSMQNSNAATWFANGLKLRRPVRSPHWE
jgi:hypothetical protein